jgi:hypothetical protein
MLSMSKSLFEVVIELVDAYDASDVIAVDGLIETLRVYIGISPPLPFARTVEFPSCGKRE